MITRLQRLSRRDTRVFREAADDANAVLPGIALVAVAMFIMGLGGYLWAEIEIGSVEVLGTKVFSTGEFFLKSALLGTVFAVAFWALWVYLAALIVQALTKRPVPPLKLFAPMSMATPPLVISLLAMFNPIVAAFGVAGVAGTVALSQTAIQDATDCRPGDAFVANMAGFLIWAIALGFLGGSDRNLAPGIFALFGG